MPGNWLRRPARQAAPWALLAWEQHCEKRHRGDQQCTARANHPQQGFMFASERSWHGVRVVGSAVESTRPADQSSRQRGSRIAQNINNELIEKYGYKAGYIDFSKAR
jgi:hypothetical protein